MNRSLSRGHPRHISWFSHPCMWLIPSVFGILFLVIEACILNRFNRAIDYMTQPGTTVVQISPTLGWLVTWFEPWTDPWLGLMVGFPIGLVTTGTVFVVLLTSEQFYAKQIISPGDPKLRWNVMARLFLCVCPMIAMGLLVTSLVYLGIVNPSVISASLVPLGMLYFEQRQIYRLAQSMICNDRSSEDESPTMSDK